MLRHLQACRAASCVPLTACPARQPRTRRRTASTAWARRGPSASSATSCRTPSRSACWSCRSAARRRRLHLSRPACLPCCTSLGRTSLSVPGAAAASWGCLGSASAETMVPWRIAVLRAARRAARPACAGAQAAAALRGLRPQERGGAARDAHRACAYAAARMTVPAPCICELCHVYVSYAMVKRELGEGHACAVHCTALCVLTLPPSGCCMFPACLCDGTACTPGHRMNRSTCSIVLGAQRDV